MGKYITKEAALNTIFSEPPDARYPSWYAKRIKALPTADVAPVVHGRWIERQAPHAMEGISAKCSICSKSVQYLGNPLKLLSQLRREDGRKKWLLSSPGLFTMKARNEKFAIK